MYPNLVSLVMVGENTCTRLTETKSEPLPPMMLVGDGTTQSEPVPAHRPSGWFCVSRWRLQVTYTLVLSLMFQSPRATFCHEF